MDPQLKLLILELLLELLEGCDIRVGGTDTGTWADFAVDHERLVQEIEKRLKALRGK